MIYLVDAHVYIFRAYYSLPEMRAPDGTATHAAYGFANTLLRMASDFDASHIACVFDAAMTSFRNDIDPEYKAGRGDTPEDLEPQFAICQEVASVFGFPSFSVDDFEADDVIATLATRLCAAGRESAVVSVDKDLAQLVRDRDDRDAQSGSVVLHDFAKAKTMDSRGVREKFGVAPEQIPDYLGLVGDQVDNLPGVPGIGPKSAAALLAHFGTIENFPEQPEAWDTLSLRGARRLAKLFATHRERALATKAMATLCCDIATLPEDPEALSRGPMDPTAMSSLCKRLGWGGIEARARETLSL